jgi:hypothetical protein
MADSADWNDELFRGLRALAESAFPKRCVSCGRTYETAAQFLAETQALVPGRTGLKQSVDDDGHDLVEVYRNCVCGSTLMEFFSDRRDTSEAGLRRRERFGELLDYLVRSGVERAVARQELLKVVHGGNSELLRTIKPPARSA